MGKEFVISRTFDAPRDLVWKAFTEPERMKHWWGPKGFTVRVAKMDFHPGGTYHYGLQSPTGQEVWGKFVYREIVKPERIVWVNSFSDEKGGVARHPMSPGWPLEMLTTLTLEEQGGKTTLTIRWVPINATEQERKTFDDGMASMTQGWTGTLDQLAAYLTTAP
ncbi:MAG: SRPBCC domain-containing protein [Candidatus Omnitrophota bacterium]|nr:SRPBCC domain-containing protein [Candidatus Omnitrophota bacterium]MDZ4242359.1 SRPBCC domain-containing protein [Candidatus Omnitrophota bacterium]